MNEQCEFAYRIYYFQYGITNHFMSETLLEFLTLWFWLNLERSYHIDPFKFKLLLYWYNMYLTSIDNYLLSSAWCLGILPNGEYMYILPDDPENYDFC